MSGHDERISYSHWGMFTLERKSSRQSNWSSQTIRASTAVVSKHTRHAGG
jgi:hypothetical protein